MSAVPASSRRKTVRDIRAHKNKPDAFLCLTAYTAPMAQLADVHADMLLVGDSLGMVIYGFDSTLPVTLDMMINHGRAVVKSSHNALVVVDMPFASCQESPEQAFRNAARVMAETGCGAVKLEGGAEMAQTVSFLSQRGIPVVGHTGLQPQSVNAVGGYRVAGRDAKEAQKIIDGAEVLAQAGAFALVLECTDSEVSDTITRRIDIPTIGIGASASCDGQVIVTDDMLGLTPGPHARFVKKYADLRGTVDAALKCFADDVRMRRFPSEEHIYAPKTGLRLKVIEQ